MTSHPFKIYLRWIYLGSVLLGIGSPQASAQKAGNVDVRKTNKYFVSTTAFIAANLVPFDDPPHYYQLNAGYRLNDKNAISVEAITWTYKGPLGRPYGKDWENPESDFPGTIRAYGLGLAYQRLLWKGFYAQVHATLLRQHYRHELKKRSRKGFQLFCTARVGYRFQFFDDTIFLEPSVAATAWPLNTGLPESFQNEEDKWPSYFLFEPGLHVGVNF